jgi:hypothetical protein
VPAGEGERPPADEWDQLAAANLNTDGLADGARAIPLEVALLHCEQRLGASWVYAPGRWDTADGCVPVRIAWATFTALAMGRALDALTTARGIGLALGSGDAAPRAVEDAFRESYPGEA